MRNLIKIIFFSLLSGCTLVQGYQPDIQQGNILDSQKLNQLRPGMSIEEVQTIVGVPILVNTFNQNHVHYVYSLRKGYGKGAVTKVIIYFQGGRVSRIVKS